jgi:hypothetical protein
MSGRGHPLPGSDEARHNEIPEDVAGEKGRGDDSKPLVQPGRDAVNPDGEPGRNLLSAAWRVPAPFRRCAGSRPPRLTLIRLPIYQPGA